MSLEYAGDIPAYSTDLRHRVLAALDNGISRPDVVRTFQASLATLERYLKQRRDTGDLTLKRPSGGPARKSPPLRAAMPPNTTLIASLTLQGMGAAMVVDSLYPENTRHKSQRVQEVIEARGCKVWFLPSYSPDLSPIELAFSKLKAWIRRAKARTKEALEEAIACALDAISASDARGDFNHCSYRTSTVMTQ